jgi:antitoxin CptB
VNGDADVRALRWRCRRGMRELDQLLVAYLDRRWPEADDAERGVFRRLLDCEDDTLWAWCMGRARPDDPELARLVSRIVDPPAGDLPA